jgi:hypothetical protein
MPVLRDVSERRTFLPMGPAADFVGFADCSDRMGLTGGIFAAGPGPMRYDR